MARANRKVQLSLDGGQEFASQAGGREPGSLQRDGRPVAVGQARSCAPVLVLKLVLILVRLVVLSGVAARLEGRTGQLPVQRQAGPWEDALS